MSRTVYIVFGDRETIFKRAYEWPDEDLCLFRNFPHPRLVYPLVYTYESKEIKCSCTIIWLVQYSKNYFNSDYTVYAESGFEVSAINGTVRNCLGKEVLDNYVKACNFPLRLSKCPTNQTYLNANKVGFVGEVNVSYFIKWLVYLIEVYFQPLACFLGILANALIILVLRNKKTIQIEKSLKNVMYKHILANSIFNLMYCLVKPLTLINICIFPSTSFCSSVYREGLSQYLKIYFTNLFGNSLRLCCNLSYIFFSIIRYFISTSNETWFFQRFQRINLNLFYSITFGLSLGLSSFFVFKYKRNEFDGLCDSNYPIDAYGYNYCEKNIAIHSSSLDFKCGLFTFFTMLNNVLNNILFLFISIFIDIGLIRFANQTVNRRLHMISPLENANEDIHLTQALKLKEKINKMILSNGLLYIISHFPDFITTVLLLVFKKKLEYSCFFVISCIDLEEMAQAFNFFSIVFQFIIFIRFDRNFRQSLKSQISH